MDSFERNLEQAQRELNIDPSNQIPVTYTSEPAWFQNLVINMLPSLLLIGALVYFGRRVSGSSAGRGVSLGLYRGYVQRSCSYTQHALLSMIEISHYVADESYQGVMLEH